MTGLDHRPLIGIPGSTVYEGNEPRVAYYRVQGSYTAALAASGAAPVAIPLNLPEETLRAVFERLDGLLLAGGGDVDPSYFGEERHARCGPPDPARDEAELKLARWALETDLPVLGICRGIQLLNVAAGGTLYQDLPAQCPDALRHDYKVTESPRERPVHQVRFAGCTRLLGTIGAPELMVNSYHHQSIKQPAIGFQVAAEAEDGVIEAIEAADHWYTVGVQWHPEGMFATDPAAQRLFAAFVAAARDMRS